MIEDTALQSKTARAIFRKAGLRIPEVQSSVASTRIRTLIDAWVEPTGIAFEYQWIADLSGYNQIRMTSQGYSEVQLYYSLSSTSAIDPGDFAEVAGVYIKDPSETFNVYTDADLEKPGEELYWVLIPDSLKRPLRLTIGERGGVFPMMPDRFDGPFSLSVQVF